LSVVENDRSICHFQIGQVGRDYLIGPLNAIDVNKAKVKTNIELQHFVSICKQTIC